MQYKRKNAHNYTNTINKPTKKLIKYKIYVRHTYPNKPKLGEIRQKKIKK